MYLFGTSFIPVTKYDYSICANFEKTLFLHGSVEVLWPSQPIRVMSSQSVYLTTPFLGRISPLSG